MEKVDKCPYCGGCNIGEGYYEPPLAIASTVRSKSSRLLVSVCSDCGHIFNRVKKPEYFVPKKR